MGHRWACAFAVVEDAVVESPVLQAGADEDRHDDGVAAADEVVVVDEVATEEEEACHVPHVHGDALDTGAGYDAHPATAAHDQSN
jgi:hypothetical protein